MVIVDKTAAPTVTIDAGPYQIACADVSPKVAIKPLLTASPDAAGTTTYLWTGPAGAVYSNAADVSTTVSLAGTYTITATNEFGCTATDVVTVTTNQTAPNITVTSPASDKITCEGLDVELNGSSTTAGATYLWSGGPATASITDPTTTTPEVDMAGTYTLTVTNPANGCTATANVLVNEDKAPPTVTLTNLDGDITCTNSTITLEADVATVSNATFTWSTTSASAINISGTYNQFLEASGAGDYTVTATNPVNKCTSTATRAVAENSATATVSIANGPTATITCTLGNQLTLDGVVSGGDAGIGTYLWTAAGGGTIVPPANTQDVVVTTAGTYTFTYYHSVTGCPASASIVVTKESTAPTVSIDPGPYVVNCFDLTPQLSATVSAGATVVWTGPGNITDETSLTPTVDAEGTYTITATNAYGCIATDQVVVSRNTSTPDLTVNVPSDITCTNLSSTISGSSTAAVDYLWTVVSGTGTITDPVSPSTTVDNVGVYALTVTSTVNGCSNTKNVTVASDSTLPSLTVVNPAATVLTCDVTSAQLSASGVAGTTYLWSTAVDGATISNTSSATPNVNKAGSYTVIATHPVSGCTETGTTVVNENKLAPTITISSSASELNCSVTSINIDASATTNANTYTWTKTAGGNIVSGQGTNKIVVNAAGTYTLTAKNTVTGCTSVESVTITRDVSTPNVAIAADTYFISCDQLTETISATGDAGSTFTWSGPGIVGTTTGLSISVDQPGNYSITATNSLGCTTTSGVTVEDRTALPDLSVNVPLKLTCSRTSVEISGSSTTADQFTWTRILGDGSITDASAAITTVDGPGTYRLTAEISSSGCTTSQDVVVEELLTSPGLSVTSPASDSLTCEVLSVQLNASATVANTGFVWSTAVTGANISDVNVSNPFVNKAGVYNVVATHPTTGCTQTANVTVHSYKVVPTITINPEATVITCTQSEILLDASSTLNADTYSWSTVNGTIASGGTTSQATVSRAGTYVLTARNSATGCTASSQVVITENLGTPTVTITGEPYTITCTDSDLSLSATASAGTSILWTGPGIVSGAETLSPEVNVTGTYTITATAANGCTASDDVFVDINKDVPDISVNNPSDITCTNLSSTISGSSTAAVDYLWTVVSGTGTITDPVSPSTTVDNVGVYALTVTSTVNGCSNTKNVTVASDSTLPSLTVVNPAATVLTCDVTSAQLSASGVAGTTYLWSTAVDGATISNTSSATPNVNKAGSYTVIATHPVSGCTETGTTVVNENKLAPTITISSSASELNCSVTSINIDASATTNANTYTWTKTAGGNIVSGQGTNKIVVNAAGTYTLTAKNTVTGCTSVESVTITRDVNPPTVAIAAGTYEISCDQTSETLNATGNAASYTWSGPGIVGTLNGLNITVNQPGDYTITATGINGCTSTDVVTVDDKTAIPDINVGTPNVLTCTRTSVSISGTSSLADTYLWTKISGEGSIQDPSAATTNVDGPGTYRLTVEISATGCSNSDDVVVNEILTNPGLSVTSPAEDSLTCAVSSVQLSAVATVANTSFEWSTGISGASISDKFVANPYVDKAGIYTVTATHPTTGCTQTATVTVNSYKLAPTVNIVPAANTITCDQETILLDASTTTNANSFSWSTANGNIVSGGSTAQATISRAGTYNLLVTNTQTGCTSTGQVIITENLSVPSVNIAGGPYEITCNDEELTLTATADAGTSILWTGPGILSGANTLNPDVNASGTYTITATAANGCSSTDNVFVDENTNAPDISVDENPEDITCTTSSVLISGNSSTSGATYLWEVLSGNANISNETNSIASVNDAGQFKLTITAPNGCTSSSIVNVGIDTIAPQLTLPAIDDNNITCSISSVKLNASSSTAGAQYSWDTNVAGAVIVNGGSATPTVNKTGDYTVTVLDPSNGCTTTGTTTVQGVFTPPTVSIAAVTEQITCTVNAIQLDASASVNAGSYRWLASDGGHILSGGSTSKPWVDAAGTYTVTVTHATTGCTASASTTVSQSADVPVIDLFDPFPDELNCARATDTLLANASALATKTIAWTTTDGTFIGSTSIPNPVVSAAGTYVVTITNTANNCKAVRSVTVEQDTVLPDILIDPVNALTCSRTEVDINSTVSSNGGNEIDYSWTAGAGGSIVSATNIPTITVNSPSVYTLTATDLGNYCVNTSSITVSNNITPPNVSVNTNPDVLNCTNTTVILNGNSTDSDVAFYWNGPGTILNRTTKTPTVNTPGTYTLTVTNNATGCTAVSSDVIVTKNIDPPTVTINAPSGELSCSNSTVTLSASNNTNYTYLWTGPGSISTPASNTTLVNTAGTYNLKVSSKLNGCISTYSTEVIENKTAVGSPVISNIAVCEGNANPAFTVTSGENVRFYQDAALTTFLASGNSYTPDVIASGTYTYYATSTGSNGCESLPREITLTIHALPDYPIVSSNSICEGSAAKALNAVGTSIKWYNSSDVLVGTGANYYPAENTAGTYAYYATQTNANSCESSKIEVLYTVNAIPAPPVLVAETLEVCQTYLNPEFTALGTNIKWYENVGGGVLSAQSVYQPSKVTPGTYNYYVTQTVNGCQSIQDTATFIINPLATTYTVAGGGAYCADLTGMPVTLSGSQLGWDYELWINDSRIVSTLSGTGNALDFGLQTEAGNYTVVAVNSTTSCYNTMTGGVSVSVKPLPADAGSISGSDYICEGEEGLIYSIAPVANASSYVWTIPNGFTIVSGENSNSITVDVDETATDGIIQVYAINACNAGNPSPEFLVTVNLKPGPALNLTGPSSVCLDQDNVQYSIDAVNGSTSYNWNVPSGATIVAGNHSRQITVNFDKTAVTDEISVAAYNYCGEGARASQLITVNELPVAFAGLDQNLCKNNTSLTANVPSVGTGTWSILQGAATISNSNDPKTGVSNLAKGENVFVWTVDNGTCSISDTVSIFNNTAVVSAGNDISLCETTYALKGNTPSVGTGIWTVIDGSVTINVPSSPTSTISNIKRGINTLVWTITNKACESSDTVLITNNMPSVPVPGNSDNTCGDEYQLIAETPSIGTGVWSVVGGAGFFDNPTKPNAIVRGLQKGDNVLRWKVTNEECSEYKDIIISNNQIEVDAGNAQIICDRQTVLEGEVVEGGYGNWSVVYGSAAFDNINNPNAKVTGLLPDTNILRWSVELNNCFSSDTVLIINNQPTLANAGADQEIPSSSTQLEGNTPVQGVGTWTILEGFAIIDDINDPETTVTELNPGRNKFRWTIVKKGCSSYDDVTIINGTPGSADAGPDQTLCNTSETQLNAVVPEYGFGSWSVVTGTARFSDEELHNTRVGDLAPGRNVLKWTISVSGMEYTDTVVITNNTPTIANAGIDQRLCADSVILEGNQAAYGIGKWVLVSGAGQIVDTLQNNTLVRGLSKGMNTFKWLINNNNCLSSDEVVIYNDLPTEAYAGIDKTTCDDSLILNPNTPTHGTGYWSVYSGSAVFDGNKAYNLSVGENKLRWTIEKNNCQSYDDVIITSFKPTKASAGLDVSICVDNYQMNGNPAKLTIGETGTWSLVSGAGVMQDSSLHNSTIEGLSLGKNVLRWEIDNHGCISYDEIVVSYDFIQAEAGTDQLLCSDETVLNANNPSEGAGEWSIVGGSGAAIFESSSSPNTTVRNLDRGTNVLRWTVVNKSCISMSDVQIINSNPSKAFAGIDRSVCSPEVLLAATPPASDSYGYWSVLSGSATFDDDAVHNTKAQNIGYGSNTFRWTTQKGDCKSTDEVIISNNKPINTEAGENQTICEDKTILGANQPSNGHGIWSVIKGSAVFSDATAFVTEVSGLSPDTVTLKWTVMNEQCSDQDTVYIINNRPTQARAGTDRVLCDTFLVLDANKAYQGIGEWSIISGSGDFDDTRKNNSLISNLARGENTLRWSITKNSCISYDDVVITSNKPSYPDAGVNIEICENELPLNGNSPTYGTGSWSIISGKGVFDNYELSNTTVRDLAQGTNKLRWTISYKGCSLSDDVLIENNTRTVNAGFDQVIYDDSTTLIANEPNSGESGYWNVVAGAGDFENSTNFETKVLNITEGLNTFGWNINVNDCVSTDLIQVTYYKMPSANYTISGEEGCPPYSVKFTRTTVDDYPFFWDFGDGERSKELNPTHEYTNPGYYEARLVVKGPDSSDVIRYKYITIHPVPQADFNFAPGVVYIPDQRVHFYNLSVDGVNYLWDFGDGGKSTETNPIYTYTEEGFFSVKLIAETEYSCKDSIVKEDIVEVIQSGTVELPTAFKPLNSISADNRVFLPIISGVEEFHMEIYNRWGVMVFESNDATYGWDGTYKGELAPEGIYVYRIRYTLNNGKTYVEAGDFMLVID